MSCATSHVQVHYQAADAEAVVVELSLGLFSDLASLAGSDPAAVPRLLKVDPRAPGEELAALGIDFEGFRQGIAIAGVEPLVLFLPAGADPLEEARRRGLAVDSWPEQAPPALLAGRELDVLVVFEPLSQKDQAQAAQVASLAELRSFALAASPGTERLDPRRYRVDPQRWSRSVLFEHTRCEERAQGLELVTKLTYAGGATDTERVPVRDVDWQPCALVSGSNLAAVKVKQTSRDQAGRNVIIASSYFRSPLAGPVLARTIPVR
jgi:hypothetical protein